MFIYELAVELDKRSSEVVEAARALGIADPGPATELSRDQVAQLWQSLSGAGAPPVGPAPTPPPPLVAEPWAEAPATSEPPPAGDPWAPAAAAPAPPATPSGLAPPPPPPPSAGWSPGEAAAPPSTPPAPAPPPPAPAPGAGPAFVPPPSFEAPAPAEATPPPPPPPPSGVDAPAAGAPVVDPDDRSGFGPGQLAVLGVLVVAVVALFGFMVVNSGPDPERVREIADADPIDPAAERREAEAAAGIDPTTTEPVETTTTAAGAAAPDPYVPLDLEAFCRGGRAFADEAESLSVAFVTEDIATMRAWVADHRQAWDDSLSTLAAGAPPINADDLMAFRGMWDEAFDAVNTYDTYEAADGSVDSLDLARANARFREVGQLVAFHCS